MNILPTGTIDLKPGKASMIIHEPIDIQKYNEEHLRDLMERARDIISAPLLKNESGI
jgi:hypothetical protein